MTFWDTFTAFQSVFVISSFPPMSRGLAAVTCKWTFCTWFIFVYESPRANLNHFRPVPYVQNFPPSPRPTDIVKWDLTGLFSLERGIKHATQLRKIMSILLHMSIIVFKYIFITSNFWNKEIVAKIQNRCRNVWNY